MGLAFFLGFMWFGAALGADYPAKPVTLVIQYPAGGSTDMTIRALVSGIKSQFGQPIIIENKGG